MSFGRCFRANIALILTISQVNLNKNYYNNNNMLETNELLFSTTHQTFSEGEGLWY